MAVVTLLFLGVLSSTLNPSASAMGRDRKEVLLMGVMGDSISAGTFSDLPLQPFSKDPRPAPSGAPTNPEVGTKAIIENKKRLSWASGNSVPSHFRLLAKSLRMSGDNRLLEVANVSHAGDRTGDLPRQAKELLAEFTEGKYQELVYLTILIGANDACSKKEPTPLSKMRADMLETFSILSSLKQPHPLRILLVGMPRIPDLGAPAISRARTPVLGLRCNVVRDKLFRYCPNLLKWKTEEQYHQAMEIVEDRNRMLRSIAAEAKITHPNLDIVYSNHLYDLEIPAAMLALDCFHPSKRGQQAISQETWLDQPWF